MTAGTALSCTISLIHITADESDRRSLAYVLAFSLGLMTVDLLSSTKK